MTPIPCAAITGVGPGLGAALARRFAAGGYAVALMSRSEEALLPVVAEVEAAGGRALAVPADCTVAGQVAGAFEAVRAAFGDPAVYIYNAGAFHMGKVLDVGAERFEACWRANCFGAFLGIEQAVPAMQAAGRGTVLLTGATAALRGSAGFSCLAVGKFGLRALGQSLARELGPAGIHVAHVIIDGMIDTPRVRTMVADREAHTMLQPDAIAEAYWQLHTQDRTCWTHELDLRPAVEKF